MQLKSLDAEMENPQQDVELFTSNSHNDYPNTKENLEQGTTDAHSGKRLSRTNSPRKVQDIHLDGTVDDMQNVDPYLLDEKDLDIQSEVGGHTGTMSSNMSVSSWKSIPKTTNTKSVVSSIDRSNSSRARRLKQHERSPFLSIDIPSETNSARSVVHRGKSKTSLYGSQHSLLSVSTIGMASQHSARSSTSDRPSSAKIHGRKLFSSASLVPPGNLPSQPNHNIKKPFKHDVRQVEFAVPSVNPSVNLKDRTAVATHAINKILHAQRPSKTQYIQGRLLKAQLKPLEPVKVTEPTIQQCRGIISETRKYTQCDSRTLQRWRAIMSGAQVQPHQEVREGASTSESIHRTSEASTPDLIGVDDMNATVFEDKTWMEELNGLMNEDDKDLADGEEKILPFASLPNSRSGPAPCGEELSIIQGPEFDSRSVSTTQREDTSAAEALALEMKDSKDSSVQPQASIPSKGEPSSDSIISVTTENSLRKFSDDGSSFDKNSHTVHGPSSKRPHSATYPQESTAPKTSSILRPKTALDTSHKAVRFADEDATDLGGKEVKRASAKTKGVKGQSSCRPNSLDSGFDDRDDPGDGNNRGSGVRTFLTQEAAKSTTSGESTTSKTSVNSSQHEGKSKKANADTSKTYNNNLTKTLIPSSSNITAEQSLSSSQNPDDHCDFDLTSHIDTNNCYPRDKAVTASVIYKEELDEKTPPAKVTSHMRSKEMRNSIKKRVLREPEASADSKETHNAQETDDEAANSTQTETSSEEKPSPNDNKSLQISGEKLDVDRNQILKKKLLQQDYNYDRYSRVPKKCTPSSAKRAKANQNLVRRIGKDRVPVSMALMDNSQTSSKSWQKDRRPGSASNFSERSRIQSKHGLLHLNTRPSSTPSEQINQTSIKQATGKQLSELAKQPDEEVNKTETKDMILMKDSENSDGKLRPKSASKVTFADDNSPKRNVTRQDSASLSLKSSLKKHLSVSSESLQSQPSKTLSDDGILGADFNRMWEEIPNYDSDEEDEQSEGDITAEDCGLISRFDDLETQFELLKSEMAEERKKFKANCCVPDSRLAVVSETSDSDRQKLSPYSEEKNETEADNEIATRMDDKTEKPTPIFVTSEHDSEEPEDTSHAFPSANQNDEVADAGIREEDSHDGCLIISSNLYKKTHLYVEISSSSSPRKERPHSQLSSRKGKAMKCVPIEDAALSHAEEKPDTDSSLLNLGNSRPGTPSSKLIKEEKRSITTIEPFRNDVPQELFDGSIKLSYRPSSKMKSNSDTQMNASQRMFDKSGSRKGNQSPTSLAKRSKWKQPNTKTTPKPTAYTNYTDILQAYRQHCMESTDGEDEDDDIEQRENEGKGFAGWSNNLRINKSDVYLNQTSVAPSQKENIVADGKSDENHSKIPNLDLTSDTSIIETESKSRDKERLKENNDVAAEDKRPRSAGKRHLKGNQTARPSESDSSTLEIVAKPKIISKLSKQDPLSNADMATLCHLPPLCFQLNARPPSGFLYYFAYDQNMNPDRLATYLNIDKSPPRFWALLFGFKLVFNMAVPDLNQVDEVRGQPNLLYNPKTSVEGCVYQVTEQQLAALDKFVGYPQHYEHVMLPVWMSNCFDSDQLGLAQFCVPALTYIAHDHCTSQELIDPNIFAVEQCLKSADIVSPQYKEHLQSYLPSETPAIRAIEVA